jgi:hypothetical protein
MIIGLAVARRMPGRVRERMIDLLAPVTLFAMAAAWLVLVITGFAMLAWAFGATSMGIGALTEFFLPRSTGRSLAAVALLSTALLLTAFTAHLVRFTGAYDRRERLVARLAGHAVRPPDAEAMLAEYLRNGSRDQVDDMFAEWQAWLADVWHSHTGYPALTLSRPVDSLCWIEAAVIVLDAAGLTLSVAPDWAPPHARPLIHTGTKCLQNLAAQVNVRLEPMPVSLQGREEHSFNDTVRLMVDAGLPKQRRVGQAWTAFQHLRTQYAPHATAIAARLLYAHIPTRPAGTVNTFQRNEGTTASDRY